MVTHALGAACGMDVGKFAHLSFDKAKDAARAAPKQAGPVSDMLLTVED